MKLYEEFKLFENMWDEPVVAQKLKEWKASNISAAPIVNADGTLDQTTRYKSLLTQIDTDKTVTYTVKDLSTRILHLTADLADADGTKMTVRIIAHTRRPEYTLQLGYGASNSGDHTRLSWDAVLDYLIIEGVIANTDLCT